MKSSFEPIAIVGQGCILPGCASPAELWQTVAQGATRVTEPPSGDWRIDLDCVLSREPGRDAPDQTWSLQGGYIRGFEEVFDRSGLALDPELVGRLDPVFQWSLYAAREALRGVPGGAPNEKGRAGVILGNLSYPSRAHGRMAEQEWIRRIAGVAPSAAEEIHPWNRFMSGLPAMLVARALGLGGGALALDAACASGLYAIKLACDRLHDRRADLMLAGGVNAADQLFLHIGFTALKAMSRTGRSRPFSSAADGLIPAEGASFVALKRFDDAVAAGDPILGVIRAVGLSNDGRGGGFLSPSLDGQVRSMRAALQQAGLGPADIQYVECHATGTQVGDATEVRSLASVYGEHPLALGSLKANLGHLLTASGVAGLIKTLGAMEHAQIPPAPGSRPLAGALASTSFRVPDSAEVWEMVEDQRTAAVSSFGFGGNNAHLIVQQHAPKTRSWVSGADFPFARDEIALVAIGVRTHLDPDASAFFHRLLGDGDGVGVGAGIDGEGSFDSNVVTLPAKELSFPPNELREALGQQLILLDVVRQATHRLAPFDLLATGIYVGMQTDSEACRYGVRVRWPELLREAGRGTGIDDARVGQAGDIVTRPLSSAAVIGKMPNVCANRLSNQLDVRGVGFAVSREELSGDAALELACTAIRRGELHTALVAAVDMSREEVHARAAAAALEEAGEAAADAAVVLVVKSRSRAVADGDRIIAWIEAGAGVRSEESVDDAVPVSVSNEPRRSPILAELGHSHAASGLLHIALAAAMLDSRTRFGADGSVQPWLRHGEQHLIAAVHNRSFWGEETHWTLIEPVEQPSHPVWIDEEDSAAPGAGHDGWDPAGQNSQPISANGKDAVVPGTGHDGWDPHEQTSAAPLANGRGSTTKPAPAPPTRTFRAAAPPALRRYAAVDLPGLLAALRSDLAGGDGPCRLALVGVEEELPRLREAAISRLTARGSKEGSPLEGVHFRAGPLRGELAFAFTGAASAYPAMGRELLLGLPELTDGLAPRLTRPDLAADWMYQPGDPRGALPFHQLVGSSFLCQLHAELSTKLLRLEPSAVLGLSSGETNAVYALGLWSSMDDLFREIDGGELYHSALANRFDAVREYWGLEPGETVDWENYRVRAPAAAVQSSIAESDRVYLCIINTPFDCVIGGDRSACRDLLARLGDPPAVPLGHDLAIHCPAVRPFEPEWRRLHTRPTTYAGGVRFYSNYFGGVYIPTEESVAEALTGQALRTLDLPRIIEQAWADGVRVFVEHGPRNTLTTAIREILGEREHLAVALDRVGVSGLVQAFHAAAQLWCAGVKVDLDALVARTSPGAVPMLTGPNVEFRLRPDPLVMPEATTVLKGAVDTGSVAMERPAPDVTAGVAAAVDGPPLRTGALAATPDPTVYVPPFGSGGSMEGRLLPAAPPLAWVAVRGTRWRSGHGEGSGERRSGKGPVSGDGIARGNGRSPVSATVTRNDPSRTPSRSPVSAPGVSAAASVPIVESPIRSSSGLGSPVPEMRPRHGSSAAESAGSVAASIASVAGPGGPISSIPDASGAKEAAPGATSTERPTTTPGSPRHDLILAQHRAMADAHSIYLRAQSEMMRAYLESTERIRQRVFGSNPAAPSPASAATATDASALAVSTPRHPRHHGEAETGTMASGLVETPRLDSDQELPESGLPTAGVAPTPLPSRTTPGLPSPNSRAYPGPAFSRAELEILAGGRISSVFGADFADQDGYAVQVRMPEPPLLLCDRVLGIEGAHHSMGEGTIWTQTDVREDSWYLHHGRMPAGLFIEAGQADLLLISWLGIDRFNRGERAYRLLGCDLVFHGELPKPGDTLEFEIHVDGHARHGDVRLFFFHYDCRVNGELRLSVRNGQAGFFSRQELLDSAGVIWTPEGADYTPNPRLELPASPTEKSSFGVSEVEAYLGGDLVACFGEHFYWAETHTRTPRTPGGRHGFLGAVTDFDLNGGPAGRGYLRVEKPVQPDEWFFDGHFKNDPCMPGTLMADGCLQAMAFYLAGLGTTLRRDGWRFEPVSEESYRFRCRGQVTPESSTIVYEIFVDEIVAGDTPTLYAHVLCTVDGRKAFLCERLGLRLVPDWPLSSMPVAPADEEDRRPLASLGTFLFDYSSLINCALGRPTLAFGQGFARYEGPLRSPRLPGPPYHFMTRVLQLEAEMGRMEAGATVRAVYDLEPDGWYFRENGSATLPNAVLMEIALQPCGWLASFILDPAAARSELLFRNLDGDSVQHREVRPGDRSITTDVRLLSASRAGGLIIVKFAVCCSIEGETVLEVETAFGFFPPDAMVHQKGFGRDPSPYLPDEDNLRLELSTRPRRLFGDGGSARLAEPRLLMLDRVTGYWPYAGEDGLGAIRAEMDVDPAAWFFKAHFFQDPVQPGSLGVEAILQAMQAFMLLERMEEGIEAPRFQPIDIGGRTLWHYRGQVTPDKGRVTVEFEATERGSGAAGAFVIGTARLSVDGLQIYRMPRVGMRIVSDRETAPWWTVDLRRAEDAWLADHRPTHTLPALPFTYELELMAAAATTHFPGKRLAALEVAEARRWVTLPADTASGRVRISHLSGDTVEVVLEERGDDGRFAAAATARMRFGASALPSALPPLEPLDSPRPVDDPYGDGSLFHGPSFHLMRELERGKNGARALLDPAPAGVPRGVLHPALLDAALHCIPHDDYGIWLEGLDADMAAYPIRIEDLAIHASLDVEEPLEVEARFRGVDAGGFPRTHLRIVRAGAVVATFDLIEILLPKGRLGSITTSDRTAFLRDGRFVPGAALSEVSERVTELQRRDVMRSDWLPGTLGSLYGMADAPADLAREIAVRDHVAAQLRIHPSEVRVSEDGKACSNLPLNPFPLKVETAATGGSIRVRSESPGALRWEVVRDDWVERAGGEPRFVHDLGAALIRRFTRRVILSDPEGFEAGRGQPVLYLANHQTAVESFLFLAIVATLGRVPAGAIAKAEHRESWIGKVHQLADLAMGPSNPLRMLFFERSRQTHMLELLREYGAGVAGDPSSLLVHVDGTRARSAGAPVKSVSSVLVDLALERDLPVVPVRFAGGLPVAEAAERLEFPWALGGQDYHIGRAIPADQLRGLPYAERAQRVRDAINSLGPAGESDHPNPPAAVSLAGDSRRSESGTDLRSILRASLEALPLVSAETEALLRGIGDSADPSHRLAFELLGHPAREDRS